MSDWNRTRCPLTVAVSRRDLNSFPGKAGTQVDVLNVSHSGLSFGGGSGSLTGIESTDATFGSQFAKLLSCIFFWMKERNLKKFFSLF